MKLREDFRFLAMMQNFGKHILEVVVPRMRVVVICHNSLIFEVASSIGQFGKGTIVGLCIS